MKRNTNFLSESMAQIEYYANKAANDLTNGDIVGGEFVKTSINLVEGEDNNFVYDLDENYDVFKWINEDAIIDFFEDYLSEQINLIEKEYGIEAEIYIEDGSLVINFPCY